MSIFDRFDARAAAMRNAVAQATPSPSNMDRLEFKQEMAKNGPTAVLKHAEIDRICALPVVSPMTTEELEAYNQLHLLAEAHDSGFRLFPVQAEGAAAFESTGGVFGRIGVGRGKTLLCLLIASIATTKNHRKMVCFLPPEVLGQLVNVDIKWARRRIPINFNVHVMGGRSQEGRRMLAKSGKAGLYLFPYSLLSTSDATDNLNDIRPTLIIADEVHRIANRSAARTRRVVSYLEEHKPQFAAMSGTITKKSIRDYWHLIRAALHENNPLPNSASMAADWGAIIDAEGQSGETGPLLPLVHWARRIFPGKRERLTEDQAGFRHAFKLRVNSTPGVVSSGDSDIGTSLVVGNVPVPDFEQSPGWSHLQELMDGVEERWVTPNGDEIEHAIHTFKWMYELSSGFFNELIWPTKDEYAVRKGISSDQASEILQKAQLHHAAGQLYYKALRTFIQERSRPGLDTPMLVGKAMSEHGDKFVTADLYQFWTDWKALDFEGRPDRDSRSVQVCPFKINAAVEWAKSLPADKGAILWVYHKEMGLWMTQALREAGIDVLHCPAGRQYDEKIIDHSNKNKKVVASMTAHGTGKNLQHFEEQYFVQWPRQADMAEQTLGRTHRFGQAADELIVHRNATLPFDNMNFASCVIDALYVHQTGDRQKLIYAAYDPMPIMYPPQALRERGFENRLLSSVQQAMLDEKFGLTK